MRGVGRRLRQLLRGRRGHGLTEALETLLHRPEQFLFGRIVAPEGRHLRARSEERHPLHWQYLLPAQQRYPDLRRGRQVTEIPGGLVHAREGPLGHSFVGYVVNEP
jgi:hypothetical protein